MIVNFKNYEQVDLNFSTRINCFVGNNGAGKTNLLDAIYYLSMGKSYFNSTDTYNIRANQDFFLLQGIYKNNTETIEEIICSYKKNGRKILKRNQKEYERFSDHIGLIPIVMVSPNDNILITEGSEERRKFIDIIISQYNKVYLNELIHYNRILQQRNKLLKENQNYTNNQIVEILEIYDEQLHIAGSKIYEIRKQFIDIFTPIFKVYYNKISNNKEDIQLNYQSQLSSKNLIDLLKQNFEKDKVLEYTSCGIHKDDFIFSINEMPLKRVASQGQQKTFLVALKLAEYEFLYTHNGIKPILLLDDIFDKFDPTRVENIIQITNEDIFGQIFVTDTEITRIHYVLKNTNSNHTIFEINKGKAIIITKNY